MKREMIDGELAAYYRAMSIRAAKRGQRMKIRIAPDKFRRLFRYLHDAVFVEATPDCLIPPEIRIYGHLTLLCR